jgi:hypothetical protein
MVHRHIVITAMKRIALLIVLFCSLNAVHAQTIGLNQTVAAEFNSVAEFQSLSTQGWIFRNGSGVGSATCATPGNIAACGFGFATDGANGVARANAQSNPEGRWIITPPIVFGNSGSVTFVLRKAAPGQGGLDVRESGGGSDTQDMAKPIVDVTPDLPNAILGGAACLPGTGSFCPDRNVRSSGAASSGGAPSCADLFGIGSDGVGTGFCTVVIRATELQNFGTGLHRLAFKMRSTTAVNANYQDMLLDRIVISTGNNDALPVQGFIYNFANAGTTVQRGLNRHPILAWNAADVAAVGTSTDLPGTMDFASDGSTLYAIVGNAPQRLVQINPADAVQTNIGNLTGFSGTEFAQALSIDPLSGQAIVIGRNPLVDLQSRLYFLNLTTAELTLQAGINAGGAFKASAISIDCQGRLFAVETSNPSSSGRLYRINRIDGSVSLIGNTGYQSTIAHGSIDFDNASGKLYGWVQAQSGAFVGYGSYSLNTGFFSVISDTPFVSPAGGAVSSKCWAAFRSGFEN